jgi:hypothetical protein
MTTTDGILGLYFYRARNAVLGPGMDLNDSSCRPDPDFDHGTLGLCRPGLRSKTARLFKDYGPVDLLFYTRGDDKSSIRLVALMAVEEYFPDHSSARLSFLSALPPNLMVAGNPCLYGTSLDAHGGHLQPSILPRDCSCNRYVARANSVYIRLSVPTATIRRDSPVTISLQQLSRLAPHGIASRWPRGFDISAFNRGMQNGAHWLHQPAEAEAVRRYFLHGSTAAVPNSPSQSRRSRAPGCAPHASKKARETDSTKSSARGNRC